jgi:hypothetical protein
MDDLNLHEHTAQTADQAFELMRVALGTLRRLPASVAPTGFAAIAHRDLVACGLDPAAVASWAHALHGFEGVTYLRPREHAQWHKTYRPPLQPVHYVAVPLDALAQREASAA